MVCVHTIALEEIKDCVRMKWIADPFKQTKRLLENLSGFALTHGLFTVVS
jgi:hypothetical protein